MPTMHGDTAAAPNHSRWMRQGRECMAARDWSGAIRAYGHGLMEQPLLGMHYAANLERARQRWRQERTAINQQGPNHTQVVVAGSELSHNAAGRAFTLAQLYQHLGHPVELLGSLFWGDEIWEPIRGADLPMHTIRVRDEPQFVVQAFDLVLQHPADLVHLSKPRLPAVLIGLLYKLLWGAAVLMDIDDEELCFVGEREPITLDGLKRLCHGLPEPHELMGPLWTRLAVDLAQRFDGITVSNTPLQERYGGTVIPHSRDPEQLRPATAAEKVAARQRFGVPLEAKVVLFFGTPRRHKGLLRLAQAVAELPLALHPLLVVAGAFAPEDADLRTEIEGFIPPQRLALLGNQPFEQAAKVLALADLVALLSEGEVAAFQSPAKLSDALAMGLPVLVSEAAPLEPLVEQGLVWAASQGLASQLQQLLSDAGALQAQGDQARRGFENILAIPTVAQYLQSVAKQALADPKAADGLMINALESLHHPISSPLMAHRFRQWSERRIDWRALQQQVRDPELVSIVVPVYGDPSELDSCLKSVRHAASSWQWELIAVMNDNSSENRTMAEFHQTRDSRVRIVTPGENTQFALGCNLGFCESRGKWIVFLNTDCQVGDLWLDELLRPLHLHPKLVAAQPRLLRQDGNIQCLGVVFSEGQIWGYQLYQGLSAERPYSRRNHLLKAVTGACLAVDAARFANIHGFNPAYINGQEDVDLCLRMTEYNPSRKCIATSNADVVHKEGASPGRYTHSQWNRLQFRKYWLGCIEADDTEVYRQDGLRIRQWCHQDHTGLGLSLKTRTPLLEESVDSKRAITMIDECLSIRLLEMAHPDHEIIHGLRAASTNRHREMALRRISDEFTLCMQDDLLKTVLDNTSGMDHGIGLDTGKPDISKPFGVNLIGHARNIFGIGEDIRMAALALKQARIPFCIIDHSAENGTSTDDESVSQYILEESEEGPYFFNMVFMAAPVHARWLLRAGLQQQKNRYTISIWPWETETWPNSWAPILDLADEYWAPSSLIRNALEPHAQKMIKPIRVQPMAVDIGDSPIIKTKAFRLDTRRRLGLPEDRIVFLCTFDPRSTFSRKNPEGTIRAYMKAFEGKNHNASLIVKCLTPNRQTIEYEALRKLVRSRQDILMMEADLNRQELLSLYSACDCLISLHRSEGYGRNIYEAGLLGLKVIATGYGGFMDHFDNNMAYLVDYDLRQINEGEYPNAAGHTWAEPDGKHATELILKVYSDLGRESANSAGEYRKTATEHDEGLAECSTRNIGKNYKKRLADIYHEHMKMNGTERESSEWSTVWRSIGEASD